MIFKLGVVDRSGKVESLFYVRRREIRVIIGGLDGIQSLNEWGGFGIRNSIEGILFVEERCVQVRLFLLRDVNG